MIYPAWIHHPSHASSTVECALCGATTDMSKLLPPGGLAGTSARLGTFMCACASTCTSMFMSLFFLSNAAILGCNFPKPWKIEEVLPGHAKSRASPKYLKLFFRVQVTATHHLLALVWCVRHANAAGKPGFFMTCSLQRISFALSPAFAIAISEWALINL
jgi:hypothetical protein